METPRLPRQEAIPEMLGVRDGEESNGTWGESCPDADRARRGELSTAGDAR